MIASPSVLAATVEPMVAVPIEMTTESRMPARISGSASGRSMLQQPLALGHAGAVADSSMSGAIVVSPVSAFSKIGSRP